MRNVSTRDASESSFFLTLTNVETRGQRQKGKGGRTVPKSCHKELCRNLNVFKCCVSVALCAALLSRCFQSIKWKQSSYNASWVSESVSKYWADRVLWSPESSLSPKVLFLTHKQINIHPSAGLYWLTSGLLQTFKVCLLTRKQRLLWCVARCGRYKVRRWKSESYMSLKNPELFLTPTYQWSVDFMIVC